MSSTARAMTTRTAASRTSRRREPFCAGSLSGVSAIRSRPPCRPTSTSTGRRKPSSRLMVENVFVLMPAYNAGATIESVFARIPEDVKPRIRRYVAVNDGSKDDTAEALARLQGAFPNLVVLTHEQNRGYGEAEKTLLRYALREGAGGGILLHSDGQYSPDKLSDLLRPFDNDTADPVQ